MLLVIVLKNSYALKYVSRLESRAIRARLVVQLIQPKLQNKQQKPPKTTSHASSPPSGNELGSINPGGAPFSVVPCSGSPCGSYSVSGRIFASVFELGSTERELPVESCTDIPFCSATADEDDEERVIVSSNMK